MSALNAQFREAPGPRGTSADRALSRLSLFLSPARNVAESSGGTALDGRHYPRCVTAVSHIAWPTALNVMAHTLGKLSLALVLAASLGAGCMVHSHGGPPPRGHAWRGPPPGHGGV